ncbi:hypothetical protein NDU88_006503 [Pleurodeles waltl]|uniref:Uncharacterized protein n=1 Tax=Pleurodeles waltl TaxID=8319 RepID=A0AAV7N7F2_PLEWA|nr:hypothetical protein NDU88_006503 [Pleurodeles waltl]
MKRGICHRLGQGHWVQLRVIQPAAEYHQHYMSWCALKQTVDCGDLGRTMQVSCMTPRQCQKAGVGPGVPEIGQAHQAEQQQPGSSLLQPTNRGRQAHDCIGLVRTRLDLPPY